MAEEEGLLGPGRTWFVDTRSPMRRLGVSSHPDEGVVVLSLWKGDRCTGTFRLPLDDARALVEAMTEGMVEGPPPEPFSPSPSLLRRIK